MVRLICVPYHLGREVAGMGAGPDRMLAAGAQELVRAEGHSVAVGRVDLPGAFEHEIGAYFALQVAVARANEFAAGGGPSLDTLDAAVRVIARHVPVNSVSRLDVRRLRPALIDTVLGPAEADAHVRHP